MFNVREKNPLPPSKTLLAILIPRLCGGRGTYLFHLSWELDNPPVNRWDGYHGLKPDFVLHSDENRILCSG